MFNNLIIRLPIFIICVSFLIYSSNARAESSKNLLNNYNATYQIDIWSKISPVKMGFGSAVALRCKKDKPIQLLTAAHVVSSLTKPQEVIITATTKKISAIVKIVKIDRKSDLAILEGYSALRQDCNSVQISINNPEIGEDVWIIGIASEQDRVVSKGIIGKIEHINNIQRYRTDADISYGYSGGGMFNQKGDLIGITHGFVTYSSTIKTKDGMIHTSLVARSILPGHGIITGLKALKKFLRVTQ